MHVYRTTRCFNDIDCYFTVEYIQCTSDDMKEVHFID